MGWKVTQEHQYKLLFEIHKLSLLAYYPSEPLTSFTRFTMGVRQECESA